MEKPMRRKELLLSGQQTADILLRGEYGTLSTLAADGSVHAVPISYVYHGGCICFHCALDGLKLENMCANPGVCFSVVTHSQAVATQASYTALYESAVVYGRAAEVNDKAEKRELLRVLCERYAPDAMSNFDRAIAGMDRTAVFKIIPDRMTGKSNMNRGG